VFPKQPLLFCADLSEVLAACLGVLEASLVARFPAAVAQILVSSAAAFLAANLRTEGKFINIYIFTLGFFWSKHILNFHPLSGKLYFSAL
jgi:hypothetical protein